MVPFHWTARTPPVLTPLLFLATQNSRKISDATLSWKRNPLSRPPCRQCTWTKRLGSVKSTAAQVVGDDDVSDGVEDKLDVVRVSRARLVAVDFLRRALVLCLELRLDVRRRFLVALLA